MRHFVGALRGHYLVGVLVLLLVPVGAIAMQVSSDGVFSDAKPAEPQNQINGLVDDQDWSSFNLSTQNEPSVKSDTSDSDGTDITIKNDSTHGTDLGVEVNGEDIVVPSNGTVEQFIPSENNKTNIKVDIQSNNNDSDGKTVISIYSKSQTTGDSTSIDSDTKNDRRGIGER